MKYLWTTIGLPIAVVVIGIPALWAIMSIREWGAPEDELDKARRLRAEQAKDGT